MPRQTHHEVPNKTNSELNPAPYGRLPRESTKAYAGFEIYRRMGPNRTLIAAWAEYANRPGHRRHRKGRFRATPLPGYWGKWASEYCWNARARAWDESVAEIARDRELDARLKERVEIVEEEAEQRRLRRVESRQLREAGRRVIARFLALCTAGELEKLVMDRRKQAETLMAGGHIKKAEREQKGVVDLFPAAIEAIEKGQRLERLAEGEATENVQVLVEDNLASLIGRVIRTHVPREEWDEVAREIVTLVEKSGGGLRSS